MKKCKCYKFLTGINILLKIHLIAAHNRTRFRIFLQNAAGRLARLVNAIKASIWRKAAGVSSISNSSGSFAGNGGAGGQTAGVNRGSRDAATSAAPTAAAVQADDGLDRDPLDEAASAAAAASKKRGSDESTNIAGAKGAGGQ